jgi:hypothetical protein
VRGEAVPQHVRSDLLRDAGHHYRGVKDAPRGLRRGMAFCGLAGEEPAVGPVLPVVVAQVREEGSESTVYRSLPPLPARMWITIRLESMSSGRSRQASEMRSPPAYWAITIARYFGLRTASSTRSTSVPLKTTGSLSFLRRIGRWSTLIFPRFGGQVDYAASAAIRTLSSNSIGLT